MTMGCEKVQELLGKYYDKELHDRDRAAVSEHLRSCARCSSELEKLERVGGVLRNHYERISASENLSGVWGRVSSDIEAVTPRPVSVWRKIAMVFSLPKPVWAAIGAVAVALILLFAFVPGQKPAVALNDCIIDKVEAESSSVMVYETDKTKMKIIWVMDQHNGAEPEKGAVS